MCPKRPQSTLRERLRRQVQWWAPILTLIFTAIWLSNLWSEWNITHMATTNLSGFGISGSTACIWHATFESTSIDRPKTGLYLNTFPPRLWETHPFELLPTATFTRWQGPSGAPMYKWFIYLPLWLPTMLSLALTFTSWTPEYLAWRRNFLLHLHASSSNHCLRCRYNRTGLAPQAPCPECGAAAPDAPIDPGFASSAVTTYISAPGSAADNRRNARWKRRAVAIAAIPIVWSILTAFGIVITFRTMGFTPSPLSRWMPNESRIIDIARLSVHGGAPILMVLLALFAFACDPDIDRISLRRFFSRVVMLGTIGCLGGYIIYRQFCAMYFA